MVDASPSQVTAEIDPLYLKIETVQFVCRMIVAFMSLWYIEGIRILLVERICVLDFRAPFKLKNKFNVKSNQETGANE